MTLELFQSGKRVSLAMQPARVLKLLLQNAGQLVTRDDIRGELWPDKVVDFEQSINASIRHLRRALDDHADTSRYIETLPRLGYRFIYPVGHRRSFFTKVAAVVAVVIVVGASILSWQYFDASRESIPPAAFESYQMGLHLVDQNDKGAKTRGIEFLEESVAIAPEYSEAWSALAKAWIEFPDLAGNVIPKARHAAEQALANNKNNAAALLQLANIAFLYDWDWSNAERLYARALTSDPANPDIHQAYASFLYVMGRPSVAKEHFRKVQELDPLSSILYGDWSWYLMVEGQFEGAYENCRKLAEVAPDEPLTVGCPYRIHLEKGELDKAVAIAHKLMVHHKAPVDWLSRFHYESGREAINVFNEWRLSAMQCDGTRADLNALNCALVAADLERVDETLMLLGTAVKERDLMLPFLALYPEFRDIHDTPEFQSFLTTMGLKESDASRANRKHLEPAEARNSTI